MMSCGKALPYGLHARCLFMDCRVEPGNDAEVVVRSTPKT
jgi:hypothetical protein